MESYITSELYNALPSHFESLSRTKVSIMGHSMGGHGALTLYLKHPSLFKSVSAFAPIANPTNCPWGQKAFAGYFGNDEEGRKLWAGNDATELVKRWNKAENGELKVLIDVGTQDQPYKDGQLLPENFENAAKEAGEVVNVRYRKDYDHSYYFVATFSEDHLQYHAKFLGATGA